MVAPWYAILNRKNSMRNDLVDLLKKKQGILLVLGKTTIDEIESKLDKIVNNKYYNDREKSIAKYPKDEQEREREIYDAITLISSDSIMNHTLVTLNELRLS